MIHAITRDWVINMDRPASWRLRKLAGDAFSKKAAESMRPHVRRFIAEAFDALRGQEADVEIVDAIARRVPARTILHLLGLDQNFYPHLHRWSVTLNAGLSTPGVSAEILDAAERSLDEMVTLLRPEIEKRRENPGDDFLSLLIRARDGDDKLSEGELIAMAVIVLIAGHDTTANTIALSTAALSELPQAVRFIRENPEGIGNAVMELMRYIAMSTTMGRIASEDFDWDGHHIKAGSFVLLMIAGANRDPAAFDAPEEWRGDRPQDGNMTFAPGQHFCIGHWLAKLQVEETLTELLKRYEPVMLDERLDFGTSIGFRGLDSLYIRLVARD